MNILLAQYAIRANVKELQVNFREGGQAVQVCEALTNGDNLDIQWFNQRKQVKNSNNNNNNKGFKKLLILFLLNFN